MGAIGLFPLIPESAVHNLSTFELGVLDVSCVLAIITGNKYYIQGVPINMGIQ